MMMNATYEWLYENYARELQQELREVEETAIERFAADAHLNDGDKLTLTDCIAALRFHCGVHSFALGLRMGMDLMEELFPTAS